MGCAVSGNASMCVLAGRMGVANITVGYGVCAVRAVDGDRAMVAVAM